MGEGLIQQLKIALSASVLNPLGAQIGPIWAWIERRSLPESGTVDTVLEQAQSAGLQSFLVCARAQN